MNATEILIKQSELTAFYRACNETGIKWELISPINRDNCKFLVYYRYESSLYYLGRFMQLNMNN